MNQGQQAIEQWSWWTTTWHIVVLTLLAAIVTAIVTYVAGLRAFSGKGRGTVAGMGLTTMVVIGFSTCHHAGVYALIIPTLIGGFGGMMGAVQLWRITDVSLTRWASVTHMGGATALVPLPLAAGVILAFMVIVPGVISLVDAVYPPSDLWTKQST